MVRLIETSPCAGLLPVTEGAVTCVEVMTGSMALVAPFKGQADAVSAVLEVALGIRFPAPNAFAVSGRGRAIWVGGGQALVQGDLPDLGGKAAVSDQSDAFACVLLTGDAVRDVLARLVPVDLRMPVGQTRRTFVGHMTASVSRVEAGFEVMVMRSMAGTLVHELERAMRAVAMRGD